jgi:hypothetical protein
MQYQSERRAGRLPAALVAAMLFALTALFIVSGPA